MLGIVISLTLVTSCLGQPRLISSNKGNAQKWRNRIYPKFGCANQGFAMQCDGIAIWDQDVLKFLDEVGEL
jgi:hypothetical protein